jgi:hypothetical protein
LLIEIIDDFVDKRDTREFGTIQPPGGLQLFILGSSNHSGILKAEIEAAPSARAYPMIENSFTSMLSGTLHE